MEKKYVKPETQVMQIATATIIAASVTSTGESGSWKGFPKGAELDTSDED